MRRTVQNARASMGEFARIVDLLTFELPTENAKTNRSPGKSLERMRHWLDRSHNPQNDFRSIHIAGTSGKGTTAYMIDALLREAGKYTGRHTSPHVYDIRERVTVGGMSLVKDDFITAAADIVTSLRLTSDMRDRLTYTEAMILMAFSEFARRNVDYGVIETGMGGRYDSTNAITRPDKLAVITKLGIDHTKTLGSSIEAIADHKSGIMPRHGDAIVWKAEALGARQVVERVATERGTKLQYVDESFFTVTNNTQSVITMTYRDETRSVENIILPPGGMYQAENAALAIRSALFLAKRDGFTLDDDIIRRALTGVQIPGRFEKRQVFGRDIIFDGAHNPQKIAALLAALDPGERPIIVVALKKTKEPKEIFDLIAPCVDKVITTQFFSDHEGVTATFAYNADDLAEVARSAGADVLTYADNLVALREACRRSRPDQRIIVTGSFYFLGELHDRLSL